MSHAGNNDVIYPGIVGMCLGGLGVYLAGVRMQTYEQYIYIYIYMHTLPDYIMMHTFTPKTQAGIAAAMKSTIPETGNYTRIKPLFCEDCIC